MFNVYFDIASMPWQNEFDREMDQLMDDLSRAFGEAGVEFIKPQVRGNGHWQASTGDTERGISYSRQYAGDDKIIVNFEGSNIHDGHNVANMIDVGNFDPSTELWAAGLGNGIGARAFPISGRVGNVTMFLAYIHGMGHTDPSFPRYFSDNAVYELYDDVDKLAERPLQAFLDRLVI